MIFNLHRFFKNKLTFRKSFWFIFIAYFNLTVVILAINTKIKMLRAINNKY